MTDLLAEGFPEHIIAALRVKLNDLEDNMDVRRMTSVGPKEA